jgi:AraC-like DNA-binding protein
MRLDTDSRPFDVDIRVPYADEHREKLLVDQWQRMSKQVPPPPGLRLPTQSNGHYAVRIKKYNFLDLAMEDQYSDAIIGKTGAGNGHDEGKIATHFTFQGEWSFTSAHQTVAIGPAEAYVRWNDRPWEFEVAHQTRALDLVVPIGEINLRRSCGALFVSQKKPSTRLLLGHLKNCIELGEFGIAARNATIELFQGMIDGQVIDDEHLSSALTRAAKEYIENRLVSDPDMNPESIAHMLHVSERTLQRAFASEGSSVMTYVRSRRLEHARRELVSTSLTVSELAARWHFTDSSHFIRAYRRRFGDTPAALRRAVAGQSPDAGTR